MPSISMVRKPPGKPGAMHSALPVTAGGTFSFGHQRIDCLADFLALTCARTRASMPPTSASPRMLQHPARATCRTSSDSDAVRAYNGPPGDKWPRGAACNMPRAHAPSSAAAAARWPVCCRCRPTPLYRLQGECPRWALYIEEKDHI